MGAPGEGAGAQGMPEMQVAVLEHSPANQAEQLILPGAHSGANGVGFPMLGRANERRGHRVANRVPCAATPIPSLRPSDLLPWASPVSREAVGRGFEPPYAD